MSTMRLCVLTVFIAAGLVAAQTPSSAGCHAQTATGAGLYVNSTIDCSKNTACTTAYATCVGATPNCTVATKCIGQRLMCMNAAAAETASCTGLNALQLSLLQVAAGQLFNASSAYLSCSATACAWLNASNAGAGANCTLDYSMLCKSPISFIATLLFRGNFTAILADAGKRQRFADAIGRDCSRALRIFGCFVRRMFVAGAKRQSDQTLVVELEVPGVSGQNADFKAAFDALAADPNSFMTEAKANYKAETGLDLTVLKIGAGTSSAAFSSIPTSAGATTATPANGTATTTATPATTKANGNTTGSPATATPSTDSTSSALTSSLLAVAVAVVAVMMF